MGMIFVIVFPKTLCYTAYFFGIPKDICVQDIFSEGLVEPFHLTVL